MTEEQLSALLRFKRYEQPPAGYYDQLLAQIHQRQRTELLRKPLWQIAFERMQTFFGEHSMGSLSYAGAMAGLLAIGIAAIGLLTPGERPQGGAAQPTLVATAAPAPAPASKLISLQASVDNDPTRLSPTQNFQTLPVNAHPGRANVAHAPRYVIDARPASYEPSFDF